MASWIVPSLIPSTNIWETVTGKNSKSAEQWVGPVEALVALAYKRFRPGAKLKISSFRITNDHSHSVNIWGEYNFDWQSVKRTILGGKGADMFNLKNPVYYSYLFLNLLPKEKARILLELAQQSVDSMIESTYSEDQVAQECLDKIRKILGRALSELNDGDGSGSIGLDDYDNLREQLRISENYLDNPLTKKSIEVWKDHLSWLENICDEFELAYVKSQQGADFEAHLNNIRTILDKISEETAAFYEKIIRGK